MDYNSDNDGQVTVLNVYDIDGYNYAPASYDITHTREPERHVRAAVGPRASGTAAGSSAGSTTTARACRWTSGSRPGLLSTGTGNRPNTIGNPALSDPTVDKWYDPAAFQVTTDNTGTWGDTGRDTVRGPGTVQPRPVAHQVHAHRRPRHPRAALRGVQPPEPPAVLQPERDDRQRGRRHDHHDALEPVLRPLRHDRAQHPVRGEAVVLIG